MKVENPESEETEQETRSTSRDFWQQYYADISFEHLRGEVAGLPVEAAH